MLLFELAICVGIPIVAMGLCEYFDILESPDLTKEKKTILFKAPVMNSLRDLDVTLQKISQD